MSRNETSHRTRNSVFFVIFILLIALFFGGYQVLAPKPVPNKKPQSAKQPSAHQSSTQDTKITVTGAIGILNCESAGAECNTLTLTDSGGKQWGLVLSDEQKQKIKTFKHVKVQGKIIHNGIRDSIQVTSYEELE